jgi:hypothetical protein
MEALEVFVRSYGYPALFGAMVIERRGPPLGRDEQSHPAPRG